MQPATNGEDLLVPAMTSGRQGLGKDRPLISARHDQRTQLHFPQSESYSCAGSFDQPRELKFQRNTVLPYDPDAAAGNRLR